VLIVFAVKIICLSFKSYLRLDTAAVPAENHSITAHCRCRHIAGTVSGIVGSGKRTVSGIGGGGNGTISGSSGGGGKRTISGYRNGDIAEFHPHSGRHQVQKGTVGCKTLLESVT
jgi:hypothetical protein